MLNTSSYSKKRSLWKVFDRIARRYDLLNRILSFGLDQKWRRGISPFLPSKQKITLLDLATGTADLPIALLGTSAQARFNRMIGMDMSDNMLTIGRLKVRQKKYHDQILLKKGDAMSIPYPHHTFDAVSMAFGIRNVENPSICLNEIYRVLKPNGKCLILEFSIPSSPFLRFFYRLYMKAMLPIIGGVLSGNFKAYQYLNSSIQEFPYGTAFCQLIEKSGFSDVKAVPFSGGIVTLYHGIKR